MKTGRTLNDLAVELARQAEAKHDFVADTRHLSLDMVADATQAPNLDAIIANTEMQTPPSMEVSVPKPELRLGIEGNGNFRIQNYAHNQIATRLKIPMKYYKRMLSDAPGLLAENVNHWFNEEHDRRMVRTLDGDVRAYLSSSYRPIDNLDLMEGAILPAIHRINRNVKIASCEVTAQKLYIKLILADKEYTINRNAHTAVNDVVQAGIIIQNSEVGAGRVSVFPFSLVLACINGMMHTDYGHQKTHVGGRNVPSGDVPEEWLRDETKEADDKALMMKLQDVIIGTADDDKFENMVVNKMNEAAGRKIEADPVKVVETTAKNLGLSEDERGSVLRHLIEDANLTQWGLANAVTRHAADVDSYDRATELERVGGQVLEMPNRDWESLLSTATKAAA
jgi:hypothetical protein